MATICDNKQASDGIFQYVLTTTNPPIQATKLL